MADRPVAYLGPEGTFSHLLARKRFGTGRELVPCVDLSAAFDVLRQNAAAQAVVPIENSSGGTIYDTVDLLLRHADSVRVQEDLVLDVRLALLGHTGQRVREIFSHFAPLHHHREWLQQKFPGAKIRPVASTAVAAALAAKSKGAAALSAPGAATLYGLDVLEFPISAGTVNVTRFYVVGQKPARLTERAAAKTTLVFRLKNQCGSLHSFLGPLSRAGINLRMIVSRPVPGHPETYVFFVEVEGREDAQPLRGALEKARRHCESLTLLGSYHGGKRFAS